MKTNEARTDAILEKVKQKRRQKKIRLTAIVSGAVALVLALNLTLFIPYTTGGFDAAKYSGSEYYPVIERLGSLVSNSRPVKKSNARRLLDKLGFAPKYDVDGSIGASDDWSNAAPPTSEAPDNPGASAPDAAESGNRYEEVTDNQVKGVTEGDLFKRSSDTLFYLTQEYDKGVYFELRAYSIQGEDSELISTCTIPSEENYTFSGYQYQREMYLSEDLTTVTVVSPCWNIETKQVYTAVIGVDVRDLSDMHVVRTSYISGNLVSSRIIGDNLLVVANFSVKYNPDFNDPEQFIPHTGTLENMESLPVEDIVLPDVATYARYTVLTTLDAETAQLRDSLALLSYAQEAYVSLENIYVTRNYSTYEDYYYGERNEIVTNYWTHNYTEISRVAYNAEGELTLGAQGTVEGTLNNRYSMDEYAGTFRIFTTVLGEPRVEQGYYGSPYLTSGGSSASLFILNVEDMSLRASVERFAPEYESVRSARFKGNKAYVCTAVVVTDPVFIFDLSDLDNITYSDTGNIPGYSISLVDFKDGTLLGIGYGNSFDLKIEIYAEGDGIVESLAVKEVDCYFSTDYKSYFIDRENGYIGLAMEVYSLNGGYSSWSYEYRLYRFDGYNLVEAAIIPLESGYVSAVRAFMAEGWLYIVDGNNFKTVNIEVKVDSL